MCSMCACMRAHGFIAQARYSTPLVSVSKPTGVSYSVSGNKVDTGQGFNA